MDSLVKGDTHTWPAYLHVRDSGLLETKVAQAREMLRECCVCPRDCGVNRSEDKWAVCKSGRYARVGSYGPHQGEEDCLRGLNGSGIIFFSHCNLRCVFCQNWDISQRPSKAEVSGSATTAGQLANMMLVLQSQGCHNINFVTPEHVVPQIVEALPLAVEKGLRLPLVYNTSAFDSLESLHLMEGLVDIYMPDFKFWDPELARRYLKAVRYPSVARESIREMHRQVGDLQLDENGLAVRGVLVRHLVMPGMAADAERVFAFLAGEISPDTYINIMDQYRPAFKVSATNYAELNCSVRAAEFSRAIQAALAAGLHRFDEQRSFAFLR